MSAISVYWDAKIISCQAMFICMSKAKFLIVQGRLLRQTQESIQYFPHNWQDEFSIINKLGFYGIEWIYDKQSEYTNPILTDYGQQEVNMLSSKYGINLENIVFDWFLHHPLFVNDEFTEQQKKDKLVDLIEKSAQTGFKVIIFPILEKNNISDVKNKFVNLIKSISHLLDDNNIQMHLETSLSPKEELDLLLKINHDKIKLCFDMGNSVSFGFDPNDVFAMVGKMIGSVHIKDRRKNGPSVPLGTGDVQFYPIFKHLKEIGFDGNYSFQVYRNKDSDDVSLLRNNLKFINNIMMKYGYD